MNKILLKSAWIFLVLFFIFYGLIYSEKNKILEKYLQSDQVPDGILNYGKLGKTLKTIGSVRGTPDSSAAYSWIDPQKALKESLLKIEIETNRNIEFKVYWRLEEDTYHERNSSAVQVHPDQKFYWMMLPDISKMDYLRLDPGDQPAEITIKKILIESMAFESIEFLNPDDFKKLAPKRNIRNLSVTPAGISFLTTGIDPQFQVKLEPIPKRRLENVIFKRKRQRDGFVFEAVKNGYDDFPSTTVIRKEDQPERWPILSIVIDERNLYHPDIGIIANKTSRGRTWERPGYVSYFENGDVTFATQAGMRIHGGKRLQLYSSYRLYFRKEYGAPVFKAGTDFELDGNAVKRLVVHHTQWPPGGWILNNVLAYDITRRIGAIAPKAKLVRLYINGNGQGIYFLAPHLNRKQLESYFGHSDFDMFAFRKRNPLKNNVFYAGTVHPHAKQKDTLKMSEVAKDIDLDNLARHLFSFVFCGTTDWYQGVAVRNNQDPEAGMFWINWDMDQSFIDVRKEVFKEPLQRKIWEQTAWKLVYREKGTHLDSRSLLFSRLMDEDPQYRRFVIRLVTDLLNHRINDNYLKNRLRHYESMLLADDAAHREHIHRLDQFFQNRPRFIRDEMASLFQLGQSIPCEVTGSDDLTYEIDGYPETGRYKGFYFPGMHIKVAIPNPKRKSFQYWIVNGEKTTEHPLVFPVVKETVIQAVMKK